MSLDLNSDLWSNSSKLRCQYCLAFRKSQKPCGWRIYSCPLRRQCSLPLWVLQTFQGLKGGRPRVSECYTGEIRLVAGNREGLLGVPGCALALVFFALL